MVCWKTFTTGIPRTYSTASVFISSSDVMYARINSLPLVFMVYPMINMAMTTGTIHAKPNCQLNIPMSNMVIAGTKIVPDKSGSWCARKEWVMLALSSMILRIRPLVFVSKKPRGIFTILHIASFRRFDSTRNAAK